jgi:alpha-beta hydrolase superfamily lysophospholipase
MRFLKRAGWVILVLFLLLNAITALNAYKFTHFSASGKRMDNLHLTAFKKFQLLLTGVNNPRPANTYLPAHPYRIVMLQSNTKISCWYVPALTATKGTVILFHGYTSNRSSLVPRAEPFLQHGYNCLLVDFMGSGGSGGNSTSIGYKEAQEVKTCYDYIHGNGERHIFLFGSSMGAVAIMKAMNDYAISPEAIILECPFSTLYNTVCSRFHMLHVPTIPMAGMLLFWGGLENGFWGFSFRPVEDAKAIKCPVLLQYGARDDRVSRQEINDIYANISGSKKLIIYPMSGHDNYLIKYKKEWSDNVVSFFDTVNLKK